MMVRYSATKGEKFTSAIPNHAVPLAAEARRLSTFSNTSGSLFSGGCFSFFSSRLWNDQSLGTACRLLPILHLVTSFVSVSN